VDTRRQIDFSGKGDPAAWRYDAIRLLLVRYRAGHADGANERTIKDLFSRGKTSPVVLYVYQYVLFSAVFVFRSL
jgi:hypothetical protein